MIKCGAIQIWFLDVDPQKSAEYQTNYTLIKSIDGCYNSLISSRFYYIGIRSKRFYDYFFDKDRKDSTMQQFFDGWPLHMAPSFRSYNTKLSKWCRMCNEHYSYVVNFLSCLLVEYEFRFKKMHGLSKFLEWEFANPINIPSANLKTIIFPWKLLNPRFRRKDIVDGYRLQFMNQFEDKNPFKAYNNVARDIPDFVKTHFNLTLQNYD